MNRKRNVYLLLTLLCLIAIISLQSIFAVSPQKEIGFVLDKSKIFKNPNALILKISIILYLALLFIGFINLITLIITNLRKKTLHQIPRQSYFPLSEEKSSKLLFSIILFILLAHILQILILLAKWNINIKALSLFLNFVIEVGVILIISKIISLKILGFNLKKEPFSFAMKSYITILPVITALLFINYFIVKNIGLKLNPNPVIGIFLSLKNNFLFFMLLAQIILFGPLSEELFFRGFLYNVVRQRYGFWLSTLMISAVFMLLHRAAQEAFSLFFLSIVLCYVYEKTKNIAVPVIFHILNNSVSAIFLFIIKTLL